MEFFPVRELNVASSSSDPTVRVETGLESVDDASSVERWRVDTVGDCCNATYFVVAGMGLGGNGAATGSQVRKNEVVIMSVSCAGVTGWAYMVGAEIMQHLIGRLERTLTWVRRRSLVLSSILAHKLGKVNLAPQLLVSQNPEAVMQKLATVRSGGAVTVAFAPDFVAGLVNNWTQPTGFQRSAVPISIAANNRGATAPVRAANVQAFGRPPAGLTISKSIDPSQAARLRARGSIAPRTAPGFRLPLTPVAVASPARSSARPDTPSDSARPDVETPKPSLVARPYVVGDVLFPSLCMRVGHIRPSDDVSTDPVKGHMKQVCWCRRLGSCVGDYGDVGAQVQEVGERVDALLAKRKLRESLAALQPLKDGARRSGVPVMSTSDILTVVRSMRPMVCARVPLAPPETPIDVKAHMISLLEEKFFLSITGALDVHPVAVVPLRRSHGRGDSSSDTDGAGGTGSEIAPGKLVFMCRVVGSTLVAVQCFVSLDFVGCTVSSVQIEGSDIRRAQAPASSVKHAVDISSFLWDFHLSSLQVRAWLVCSCGLCLFCSVCSVVVWFGDTGMLPQDLFVRLSERKEVPWQESGVALLSFSKPIRGLTAPLRTFANMHPPPRAAFAVEKHTVGLHEPPEGLRVSTRKLVKFMSGAEDEFGYCSLRCFNEPTTLFVTVGNELFESLSSKRSRAVRQVKKEFQCTLVIVAGAKNLQARYFLIMSGIFTEKDTVTKVSACLAFEAKITSYFID